MRGSYAERMPGRATFTRASRSANGPAPARRRTITFTRSSRWRRHHSTPKPCVVPRPVFPRLRSCGRGAPPQRGGPAGRAAPLHVAVQAEPQLEECDLPVRARACRGTSACGARPRPQHVAPDGAERGVARSHELVELPWDARLADVRVRIRKALARIIAVVRAPDSSGEELALVRTCVHTRIALAQCFGPQSTASHGAFERHDAMWCPYSCASTYSRGPPRRPGRARTSDSRRRRSRPRPCHHRSSC